MGSAIVDGVFNFLKISVMVIICFVFMIAIFNLFSLITSLIMSSFIGEFFALVSMYLPFNALAVFGAIGTVCVSILAFLIAKKIYDLTSWSINSI